MAQKRVNDESNGTSFAVHDAIREMILNKELLPGEKINQLAMSKLLKTSRTPVINALHRLETEGLVESQKNTGFFVHRLSIKELLDLFVFREALDIVLVNDLITFATDEELASLEDLFSVFLPLGSKIDPERYRRADVKFHLKLVKLCQNQVIHKVNNNLQIFARSYTAGLIRPSEETLPEHLAIIAALRERDSEKAEKALRLHSHKTRILIQETINGMLRIKMDPSKIHIDEISINRK